MSTPASFIFKCSTDEALDERLGTIEWLWQDYIPKGFVTVLAGDQDQGKSTIAQSLCDVVLRGSYWPDGSEFIPAPDTRLLWIDTEGSIALFHDRLKKWGMPRGRFILPEDPLQELTVDNDDAWLWIETAIETHKPPLVVIDSLSGSHGKKENANDEMKDVMKRLTDLAQHHNMAVLVIHHLSKPAPRVPLFPITIHRLRGAGAIAQLSRSILALGVPDPNLPDHKRLDVIKLNLVLKPNPIGYTLTNTGPSWCDAPEPPKPRSSVDDAIAFLLDALSDGQRLSSEVDEERKAAGIPHNAFYAAKRQLRVKSRRVGGAKGQCYLSLPIEDG